MRARPAALVQVLELVSGSLQCFWASSSVRWVWITRLRMPDGASKYILTMLYIGSIFPIHRFSLAYLVHSCKDGTGLLNCSRASLGFAYIKAFH